MKIERRDCEADGFDHLDHGDKLAAAYLFPIKTSPGAMMLHRHHPSEACRRRYLIAQMTFLKSLEEVLKASAIDGLVEMAYLFLLYGKPIIIWPSAAIIMKHIAKEHEI